MDISIPESMQSIRLEEENGKLQARQIPVPKPGPGEVLVRMAASIINPADIVFLNRGGAYTKRKLSVVPGIEGSGTVVASGSGFLPMFLKGKRVACSKPPESDGTWADYMLTKASLCAPLQKNVSLEKGANLVVNPMTVVIFLEMIKEGKHAAVVYCGCQSTWTDALAVDSEEKHSPHQYCPQG